MDKDIIHIDKESYRLLVEGVKEYAIFMIDENGYVISWNSGAQQIKGYTEEEILGRHCSIFYTAESIEKGELEKNLRKARIAGQFEAEGWRVRKDGSVFWANVVYTALRDNVGRLLGFSKVTRDMTKRLMADEEIRRLNGVLQVQLDKTKSEVFDYKHALDESCIVAITNKKGIITYVNNNFCKISKYTEEELIGQDHRIINSSYHPKEFIRELWVTIANGRIWRGELRNKAKDGTYYWVDTTIVPFLDEKGRPHRYLAIRNDISQRKQVEDEIVRMNEDLEIKIKARTRELTDALEREKELSEMKSRFVSMASHEFRTPLSAILSSVSLIGHYKEPEQDEKKQKHIERIKSSVRNLTEILDGFLSLEKLEQGKVEAHSAAFNLYDFIEDVTGEVEGMLKKKNQKISFIYEGRSDVVQDKKILRNVLLNLLSNAIKYSGEEKEISITAAVSGQSIVIAVKDQGIGIPAEAQKDLFGKFFRADNAANIQGTGLGLNIVLKYVELLGGSINFVSIENEGSTFTLDLPTNTTAQCLA